MCRNDDGGDAAELPLPNEEVAAVGVVVAIGVAELVEIEGPFPNGQVGRIDVAVFVEFGGKVLAPMVKRIAPDAKTTSVISMDGIEALVKEI